MVGCALCRINGGMRSAFEYHLMGLTYLKQNK
jgi:hypothetical protein